MEAKSNSKKGSNNDKSKTYSVTDISIVAVIAGVVGLVVGMILMKSHTYFTHSGSDEIAYLRLNQGDANPSSNQYAPPPLETRESEI